MASIAGRSSSGSGLSTYEKSSISKPLPFFVTTAVIICLPATSTASNFLSKIFINYHEIGFQISVLWRGSEIHGCIKYDIIPRLHAIVGDNIIDGGVLVFTDINFINFITYI